jgi:opacity protein-like surface antigen
MKKLLMIALMTLVLMSCAEKQNYDKWKITVECSAPSNISIYSYSSSGVAKSNVSSFSWEGTFWKETFVYVKMAASDISNNDSISYTIQAKRNKEQLPIKTGKFVGQPTIQLQ